MLPYLLKKRPEASATTVIQRTPDNPQDEGNEALEACCKDMLSAMQAQNPKQMAEALSAAFSVLESMSDMSEEEYE